LKLFSKKHENITWGNDAEEAVGKAPFFIRSRIRTKVEEFCRDEGKNNVTLDIVNTIKSNFTNDIHKHIKGYQISACFSSSGCPHRILPPGNLLAIIEEELKKADIHGFLKSNVKESLKFHHELRVTLADCPNACSQPQIADFGIIAASAPIVSGTGCTLCEKCTALCPDRAITLDRHNSIPVIDSIICQKCGICSRVCKTGGINEEKKGYRILPGGRLGRHPRLGLELPGIFSEPETLAIFKWCLDFYLKNSKGGKRFSHIFMENDYRELTRKIDQHDFSS